MLNCFPILQDPNMLIFFTNQDLSPDNLREKLEQFLTTRTGVKCVVIDLTEFPFLLEQTRNEADYIKEMLNQQRKERTEYREEYRKASLGLAVSCLLSFCCGFLFILFFKL